MRGLVIADDHQLMRDGLRGLIERSLREDIRIMDEAADLPSALRAVRQHEPDLLVLDVNMPGGSAVETVATLVREQPGLAVLMLTIHDEARCVTAALTAGARGYMLKQSANDEFVLAVRALLAGKTYVDARLRGVTAAPSGDRTPLSEREMQVVSLLAHGLTYQQVGERLQIGARTVETHRRNLMEKLGLSTKADLLRYALEAGLVAVGDADRGSV